MNKLLAIAVASPMLLIGAAYPDDAKREDSGHAGHAASAVEAPVTYRPCSPGPGDDRCIQLYERGVRAAYARWLRERGVSEPPRQVAMGGLAERRAHAPRRRQAAVDRCAERASPRDGAETRGM